MNNSQKFFVLLPLAALLNHAWAQNHTQAHDTEADTLPNVVISAPTPQRANTVTLNPKSAVQPMPAQDGADLLRTVPNMSVIRKGGTSGDPLLRGLGGSRLSITADGQFIYGGCGGRMDPPTAYIFPSAFDKVVITKGPQTVTQGTGMVAGAVRFIRNEKRYDQAKAELQTALTAGNNGRFDLFADAALGNPYGSIRINAGYNHADDYQDGNAERVHSAYERNNQMLQLTLTPSDNTFLQAAYERSRGEAAYADRMMDGSKFDRDAWNIRVKQHNLTPWWNELSFNYGRSEIDHVMDNYSLRPVIPGKERANNPKRNTDTTQLSSTFGTDAWQLQTGIDYMRDKHASRSGKNYAEKPYLPNQNFTHWGGFAEAAWQATDSQRWTAGYRHDRITAVYDPYPDNDPMREQTYRLNSGFIRWEQQKGSLKYYAGIGTAQRAPDYWERNRSEELQPERNKQIDAGIMWKNDRWETSFSVFGSRISRFILTQKRGVLARNIDAERYGAEAEAVWKFAPGWQLSSSLAYTYGKNRTDDRPLAQTPPLEWKTGINWSNDTFNAGALWRVAAPQKRYAQGQGNIIGQDTGPSAGFGVLSLNAGWKINSHFNLLAGIDNVFNKPYAEFANKGSYEQAAAGNNGIRVSEPGRSAWVRLEGHF